MHFVWFFMWFCSPRVLESRLRRGWDSETSGEKSISHGKPYKNAFSRILYTSRHVSHAKYTAQSWISYVSYSIGLVSTLSTNWTAQWIDYLCDICDDLHSWIRTIMGLPIFIVYVNYITNWILTWDWLCMWYMSLAYLGQFDRWTARAIYRFVFWFLFDVYVYVVRCLAFNKSPVSMQYGH